MLVNNSAPRLTGAYSAILAKLKNLAQRQTQQAIAAELGHSVSATAVKAHQLGVSLKVPAKNPGPDNTT
jgi:hypothetical protein